jgi:hypothetical protein
MAMMGVEARRPHAAERRRLVYTPDTSEYSHQERHF